MISNKYNKEKEEKYDLTTKRVNHYNTYLTETEKQKHQNPYH